MKNILRLNYIESENINKSPSWPSELYQEPNLTFHGVLVLSRKTNCFMRFKMHILRIRY